MKYKVGNRVKIKSLDWYNENKDEYGIIIFSNESGDYSFTKEDARFCGRAVTIAYKEAGHYLITEDDRGYFWIDEMIEGLVEEENEKKLSDESWRYKNIFDNSQYPQSFECPEGCVFKDENGKIITATKIVLEKKKKEYPKTLDECSKVLGIDTLGHSADGYKWEILSTFQNLLICRDAYWKIAGEEMGLGKPWENGRCEVVYSICRDYDDIVKQDDCWGGVHIFEFPTREMRDAFKENFDPDIEICKELL